MQFKLVTLVLLLTLQHNFIVSSLTIRLQWIENPYQITHPVMIIMASDKAWKKSCSGRLLSPILPRVMPSTILKHTSPNTLLPDWYSPVIWYVSNSPGTVSYRSIYICQHCNNTLFQWFPNGGQWTTPSAKDKKGLRYENKYAKDYTSIKRELRRLTDFSNPKVTIFYV